MATIKELLGQGDVVKHKRNFLQENVRRLKEIKPAKANKLNTQRSRNSQPLTERRNVQTMVGNSRSLQESASSRPWANSPPHSKRAGVGKAKQVTLELSEEEPPVVEEDIPKGYRSQGCQTLNGKQLENLYREGVIRYPSARLNEPDPSENVSVKEMGLQTETRVEVLHLPQQVESGLHWDEEKNSTPESTGPKDFVKMNAAIPEQQRRTTDPDRLASRTDPNRAPSTYQRGVVPKYLKEHKKELQRERIIEAKRAADECPEGHILLPDEIRVKHLTTLKQNYADLVSQLNQLPVSTDTLRTRSRKKQIEADLDKIEAAIALFSREKVFVKADS